MRESGENRRGSWFEPPNSKEQLEQLKGLDRMNQDEATEAIIEILVKKYRSTEDVFLLSQLLKKVEFFIKKKLNEKDLRTLATSLKYVVLQKGEFLFKCGSYGETFYILLKGHVGIFVPTNKKQRMSILSSGNIKRKATNSPKSNEIKINSPKSNEIKVQVVAEEESPRSEERKNIRRKSATKANLLNMQMLTRGSGSKSSLNLFQQSPARAIKEEEEDVSSSEMGTIESIDDDAYAVNDMLRAGFIEVANVFDGGSFGELALLTNKPRAASILAREESHCAVVTRSDFESILRKVEERALMEITKFLHALPYFNMCPIRFVQRLQFYFTKKTFKKHEVVFRQGDPNISVYIIKEGSFKVQLNLGKFLLRDTDRINKFGQKSAIDKYNSQLKNGKEYNYDKIGTHPILKEDSQYLKRAQEKGTIDVVILGFGEIFGEDDAVMQRSHMTTVSCASDSAQLLEISAADFIIWVKSISLIWHNLNKMMIEKSKRLRRIAEQYVNFKSINTFDDLLYPHQKNKIDNKFRPFYSLTPSLLEQVLKSRFSNISQDRKKRKKSISMQNKDKDSPGAKNNISENSSINTPENIIEKEKIEFEAYKYSGNIKEEIKDINSGNIVKESESKKLIVVNAPYEHTGVNKKSRGTNNFRTNNFMSNTTKENEQNKRTPKYPKRTPKYPKIPKRRFLSVEEYDVQPYGRDKRKYITTREKKSIYTNNNISTPPERRDLFTSISMDNRASNNSNYISLRSPKSPRERRTNSMPHNNNNMQNLGTPPYNNRVEEMYWNQVHMTLDKRSSSTLLNTRNFSPYTQETAATDGRNRIQGNKFPTLNPIFNKLLPKLKIRMKSNSNSTKSGVKEIIIDQAYTMNRQLFVNKSKYFE